MNGSAAVGLMLAGALVVLPASPWRRLSPTARPGHQRRGYNAAWIPWVAVGILGCAAVALPLTTILAIGVAGATASLRYRRRRRSGRSTQECRSLEAALDVLVGELRVGTHPVRAFDIAADESKGFVAAALRAVSARARLGADVTGGLRAAAANSALPEHWERLAVYWQLASEHGLAIATLMRAAQRDIAERQRFSAQVAAGLAGARATAGILAALPVLGVLLGQLLGARPLSLLLNGRAGGWLLVVGLGLACGGLLWSDRITDRVAA
ncbi:Flp pilus assembly protein TadB [Mycobacterium basiliense]|uniref:Flp pilus assembly protein TadB n=1 Tax=Mycobacterium basiliense TaxID=2094119 RepID=A0A3S4BJC6_9MYCO|nr:type II secretion system F family protein [Mycobacterium basiliense]VDM90939.1 Flp pilus assembly protein TadB [Mycobacterium basiliense]